MLVVASFYPLADFAQQVGGDFVTVQNITPAGTEPHDFEPTPQNVVALHQAKVFIYNGAGLEIWSDKVFSQLTDTIIVKASDGISLSASNEGASQLDPHIWMNPILAQKEIDNIKNGFMKADPQHTKEYEANARRYQTELSGLDYNFRTQLAHCDQKTIVTSHDAFEYLAKQYGLSVESISGLSPDSEPSPKKLAQIADFVKKHSIKYIFFETLVSPQLSETIAHETGAQTIAFNPLEGLSDKEISEGKNYLSLQKDNLKNLQIALACH